MRYVMGSEFVTLAQRTRQSFHNQYLAMYSGVFDAIIKDPVLMLVPLDDHMVHRGDGVFEAFKCVEGNLYNVKAHWDRLERSAAAIDLKLPVPIAEMQQIVIETVRAGGERNCTIRIYVSRGPGSFDANPYACPRSQLYVAVTRSVPPFMALHPKGASVASSQYRPKETFFAEVKSCNYLLNVLMEKEAIDRHVDFVLALTDRGMLAEGATENGGIVTADGRLLFPRLEGILRGTTMLRSAELARALVPRGLLSAVSFEDIPLSAVQSAREILIVGTTLDVVAVTQFDGKQVGDGTPGPVYRELAGLLDEDMRHNPAMLTPVF